MRVLFFSAASLASSLVFAAAPIDGWYASAFGGYSYLPGNFSNPYYGFILNRVSYDAGYNAGGRIGFQNNPMRYEGEITYINANVRKFYVNHVKQIGVSGQSTATLAMATIYYDFQDIVPCIAPFLGVGIGYTWLSASVNGLGPLSFTQFRKSNTVFAYQATAGLTYNFSDSYALNVAYRYVGTKEANRLGKGFQSDLASLGVIYRFDESDYK